METTQGGQLPTDVLPLQPSGDIYKGVMDMQALHRFLRDNSGATAIEYGLIAAGVALAIIAVVNGLGTKLNTKFGSISSSLH